MTANTGPQQPTKANAGPQQRTLEPQHAVFHSSHVFEPLLSQIPAPRFQVPICIFEPGLFFLFFGFYLTFHRTMAVACPPTTFLNHKYMTTAFFRPLLFSYLEIVDTEYNCLVFT